MKPDHVSDCCGKEMYQVYYKKHEKARRYPLNPGKMFCLACDGICKPIQPSGEEEK